MQKYDKFIVEDSKRLPVIKNTEIVVCGGGIAGAAAALAAARNGADVTLIEKNYGLGGLATLGLIASYLPLCDGNGNQVIGGISEEFFHLAIKYGPDDIPDCWKEGGVFSDRIKNRLRGKFNHAWLQIALERVLLGAGVDIIYDSRLCGASLQDGGISAVIIENKSGRCAITCKAAIDATGDADLCYFAGEETVTLDSNRSASWFFTQNDGKAELRVRGDLFFEPVPEGSRTYSGVDWEEISEFMILSRKLAMDDILLKRESPEFKNTVPHMLPSIPQFRKTRRLKGLCELVVNEEDDENVYYEDAIGMAGYYRKQGLVVYYPYRSLIGKAANLFAAGRCISSKEEYAWNISRGIPSCAITGQAAGTAAALCVKKGSTAQELDVKMLQDVLLGQGVMIDKKYANRTLSEAR